jgi:hypothetical protein
MKVQIVIYVQLKVQLDVHIMYSLFLSISSFVSGAIAPILRSSNCSLQPKVCVMVLVG